MTERVDWSAAESALLQRLVEDGHNDADITEEFAKAGISRTYKAIQRKRQHEGWHAKAPASRFRLDEPVVLDSDNCLLLFDIHAPLQHAPWINRVMDLADRWGVHDLGIGGDLVDFSSICYWGRSVGIEWADEIEAGEAMLRTFKQRFKRVVYCGGNHEWRMVRKLDSSARMIDVLRMFTDSFGVTATNRQWFTLRSKGVEFVIAHPGNYSRIPGSVASKLASKYRTNVIAGHTHLWAQTRDVSNGWWVIDGGCCLDAQRVGYLSDRMTTNPNSVLGAVIVRQGVPVLLGEHNIRFYEAS
jgi:hypothetical protein